MRPPMPADHPVPDRPPLRFGLALAGAGWPRRLRWRHFLGFVAMLAIAELAVGQFPTPSTPLDPSGEQARTAAHQGIMNAQVPTPSGLIDARPGRDVAGSGDLIGFSSISDGGQQTITLVNTRKLWMAVYHVNVEGSIQLVSSRPIDADFSLELNVTDPKPSAIRDLQ
ncbi:MAG: hypothetical protein AAGD07_06685 [Planctomycetota bacterium]